MDARGHSGVGVRFEGLLSLGGEGGAVVERLARNWNQEKRIMFTQVPWFIVTLQEKGQIENCRDIWRLCRKFEKMTLRGGINGKEI